MAHKIEVKRKFTHTQVWRREEAFKETSIIKTRGLVFSTQPCHQNKKNLLLLAKLAQKAAAVLDKDGLTAAQILSCSSSAQRKNSAASIDRKSNTTSKCC